MHRKIELSPNICNASDVTFDIYPRLSVYSTVYAIFEWLTYWN